jgi:polyisoprenoid-binding protein YceI
MRNILLILTLAISFNLISAPFEIDRGHSKIEFKIPYLKVSSVTGTFKNYESKFDFDPKLNELKNIEISIDASSIDTGIEGRDSHLKNADFFDVPNHPKIVFKAPIAIKKDNKFVSIEGEMTLRGVTKKQIFTIEILDPIEDLRGTLKYPFKASTVVNRKEYNIAWNQQTKHGTWVIGDEVSVAVEGLAMAKN